MKRLSIRQYGLLSLCGWPGNQLYDGGAAPHSAEATDAFVRWALTVMRRYNTPDAIWELWNEPNGPSHGGGFPVDEYTMLANKLGAAVRAAPDLRHITLVGPATAGINLEWLGKFLASGALNFFDAVSVHPCEWHPCPTSSVNSCVLSPRVFDMSELGVDFAQTASGRPRPCWRSMLHFAS
jgi:hypothetical protein